MIHEQAIVVGVKGNDIEIDVQRQQSCGGCSLSKSCGVGALGRLFAKRSRPLFIRSELNLKPGDHILLGIADQGILMPTIMVYGLPLLMLLISALVAHLATNGAEIAVSAFAITGFAGGVLLSSILVKSYYMLKLNPTILKINNEPISGFEVIKADLK